MAVMQLSTSTDASVLDREPFFYIDGTEYTIPKRVPANVFMAYLRDLSVTGSEQVAQAKLLDALIGPEAVNALAKCDSLKAADLKTLLAAVAEKVAGAAEEFGGK